MISVSRATYGLFVGEIVRAGGGRKSSSNRMGGDEGTYFVCIAGDHSIYSHLDELGCWEEIIRSGDQGGGVDEALVPIP